MRKQTLGAILEELFTGDFTSRLRVERIATTDTDEPAWSITERGFDALILQAGVRDRVARSNDYNHPLTHNGFCDVTDGINVGCRLIETHRKDEFDKWHPVASADAQMFFVMGIERIPGMPEPYGQLRLDLWQMTEVRKPDDKN